MKVVIAGGSGLIGRRLASALLRRGDRPIMLSRNPSRRGQPQGAIDVVGWDPQNPAGEWTKALVGAEAVVNLAGASVGSWPWTAGRKRELVSSRINATTSLVQAMLAMAPRKRPAVLVNASGTDAYEGRDSEPATEETPPADTFLARLCLAWEAAAMGAQAGGVRVVVARMSLVVDREAPAFQRFVLPVRLFVGGRFGNGQQWLSWVHIDDAVRLILRAIDQPDLLGIVNVAAPDPRPQHEFMAGIAQILGRPLWLPVPALAVRLALGDQATLVLGSRRVWPARALALGFDFRYAKLEGALSAELARRAAAAAEQD
jgi:uncharacterized protein (TIGR01777 family)